jgi:predicted DNA-binding ribbon-helix-helix protein
MRTTLDLDTDILQVAKEIAQKERCSAGVVLSRLARAGYQARSSNAASADGAELRNGVLMLPKRGELVTLNHVQQLMDEEGI